MSHTDIHNHLTGAESLDTSIYSHVVTIRKEKLKGWKGYEVISESTDSYLIGKKKSAEHLKKDTDVKSQKLAQEKQRIVDQDKLTKERQKMIEDSKETARQEQENIFNEAVEKRVKEEIEKMKEIKQEESSNEK